MFRSEDTIITQLQFAEKAFLANATIISDQTEVGIVTKPNRVGYTAIMLDFLTFAVDVGTDTEAVEVALDYVITN